MLAQWMNDLDIDNKKLKKGVDIHSNITQSS